MARRSERGSGRHWGRAVPIAIVTALIVIALRQSPVIDVALASEADSSDGSIQSAVESFFAALQKNDARGAEAIGNAWVSRPEEVLALVDDVVSGRVHGEQAARWAGFVDICIASYMLAPQVAGVSESRRNAFLARAFELVYNLPPKVAEAVLGKWLAYDGLRPEFATYLVDLLGFPWTGELAAQGLERLRERGQVDFADSDFERMRHFVATPTPEESWAGRVRVLGVLLSMGRREDLALAGDLLDEFAATPQASAIRRVVVLFPEPEPALELLIDRCRRQPIPGVGFGLEFLSVPLGAEWHQAAAWAYFENDALSSKALLLETLVEDGVFLRWAIQWEPDLRLATRALRLWVPRSVSLMEFVATLDQRVCVDAWLPYEDNALEFLNMALSAVEDLAIRIGGSPGRDAGILRDLVQCLAARLEATGHGSGYQPRLRDVLARLANSEPGLKAEDR